MKDIIITGRRIRCELLIFAACAAVMELINIYAIFRYDGRWTEVFTNLGFVVAYSVGAYAVLAVVRIIAGLVMKLFKKLR